MDEIANLEKQTLLTNDPAGIEVLQQLRNFSHNNLIYMSYLYILVYGVGSSNNQIIGKSISLTDPSTNITQTDYIKVEQFKYLYKMAQSEDYKILKSTPAGQMGAFEESNSEGVITALNPFRLDLNPFNGAQKNGPSLVEYSLNKIHPQFYENLEKTLVAIKTHSYLALPPTSFEGLTNAVAYINGVVSGVQKIIFSVYQGVIKIIQKLYSYLNAIKVKVQQELLNIIEQIIPLDLICLILDAVQTVLDDINFFTSLFGQTGSIFTYLNQVQDFINLGSTWVSNPFTTLEAYLPADVVNIMQTIDQIGSDPNGFITDQLSNYGYSYVVNALQGDILGALVNKFGAQYAAIGPLATLLQSGEDYARNLGIVPNTPAIVGPNVYNVSGYTVDENLNKNE